MSESYGTTTGRQLQLSRSPSSSEGRRCDHDQPGGGLAYLEALEHADLEGVLRLFADRAVAHSPLYGELTAREFYPALFLDTASTRLRLRSTMTGGHDGARGGLLVRLRLDARERNPSTVQRQDLSVADRLRHRPDPCEVRLTAYLVRDSALR